MSFAKKENYWSDLAEQEGRESETDAARYYGMKAEEYATERWDLIEFETGHSDLLIPYDHRFSDRPEPVQGWKTGKLPGNRRKIQVKGARLKIKDSDGSGGRAGRFRLWDGDHETLVAEDALYLFLGYDPNRRHPVKCTRFIEARELAEVIGGLSWYDSEHSTKNGRPTQICVRDIFPDV